MTILAIRPLRGRLEEPPPGDPSRSLRRVVQSLLRSSGYSPLRRVECDVIEDVVVLSGRVGTFFMKQMAQAVLLRSGMVREVRNLIRVD